MKRSIRLLIIALGLIIFAASSAWAQGLTIPNTFTAGTIAKANEVNENFSAVAGALPMLWAESKTGKTTITDFAWHETNSVSIDVPSDGFLIISGTSWIENIDTVKGLFRLNAFIDGSQIYNAFSGGFSLDAVGADRGWASYTMTAAVTAGTHTVSQEISSWSDFGCDNYSYGDARFTVLYIPLTQGNLSITSVGMPINAFDYSNGSGEY